MIEGGIEFVHQKAVWVDKTAGFPTCPPKCGMGGQNGRVSNLSTEKRFGWREYVKRVSEENERRE